MTRNDPSEWLTVDTSAIETAWPMVGGSRHFHGRVGVTRIPVYVVLEKVATNEAAASLVAAMKFVVALECFDFR
jgi:hypothetical protein